MELSTGLQLPNGSLSLPPISEASLTNIAASFQLTFPEGCSYVQRREICFTATLQDCLDERWERIRNVKDALQGLRDQKGCSVLFALLPRASTSTIELILKRNFGELLSSGDFTDVLHAAVRQGNASLVALLWEHISQNKKNYEGKPPLHIAVETGQRNLVAALKANGAYLKATYRMGERELTPIAWAVATGRMECLEELIDEQVDLQEPVKGVGNLLHVAIQFGRILMLEKLLNDYWEVVQPLVEGQNEERQTPLLMASAKGDCEAICLLKQARADLGARDNLDRTSLHLAALHGRRQAVELLVYFGLKTDARDHQNQRPQDITANQSLREYLVNLSDQQRLSAPLFAYRPPENLVIGNGDVRGILTKTALETLEKNAVLDQLVRVVGIGLGAIGATFCALGNLQPLQELSLETLFGCSEATFQKTDISMFQGTEDPVYRRQLLVSSGFFYGDTFRQWMEGHIAKVTGLEHCTFGEFAKKMGPRSSFKHLHLFAIEPRTEKLVLFSSEDPDCASFILSDVIQIAISLWGFFQPHSLFCKNQGKRERVAKAASFLAGVPSNFHPHSLTLKFSSTTKLETIFHAMRLPIFDDATSHDPLRTVMIDAACQATEARTAVISFLKKGANLSGFLLPVLKEKGLLHIREPLVYFVGRNTELERLKKALLPAEDWSPKQGVALFSLCGPAGIGKSEIACQFAHLYESAFSHIFWINAQTDETLHQSYCVLAETLQIFDRLDSPDEMKRKVLRRLEDNQFGKPWLLILDHAQEKMDIPSQGGAVLKTTRKPLVGDSAQCLPLTFFMVKEATDLLKRMTRQDNEKELLKLARTLRCFPLALTQAALYIAQAGIPIEEYLQELQANPQLLLVPVGSGRYPNSLEEACAEILATVQNPAEEEEEEVKEKEPSPPPYSAEEPKVVKKPKKKEKDGDCNLL